MANASESSPVAAGEVGAKVSPSVTVEDFALEAAGSEPDEPHTTAEPTYVVDEGEDSPGSGSSDSDRDFADVLHRFAEVLALPSAAAVSPPAARPAVLSSFDLKGVAHLIASGRARRIVCMCGAGISVSAGIPDFRTPGTGLYSRLAEYKLPHPTAVFEIDFFRRNPGPFYLLAKELYPGNYAPTPTHHFMRLLHDKGLLLRCYTQNIDSLEVQAGLPMQAVVAAHGNFDTARCIACKAHHDVEQVRRAVMAQDPCRCSAMPQCGGLVKPDIVFFGEPLPERFWSSVSVDFEEADLLIVMGTSLVVQPFASLIDRVDDSTPRLLINRERVGEAYPSRRLRGFREGFCFGEGNHRDALFEGDCDNGARQLADMLGWGKELDALIAAAEGGAAGGGADEGTVGSEEDVGPAISVAEVA